MLWHFSVAIRYVVMATVRAVVLSHGKKKDGTWNVKIRISYKRKSSYINTQHYVVQKQLRSDLAIKDQTLLSMLNPVLDGYRKKISELGEKLQRYTAESLTRLLTEGELVPEKINILEFGAKRINELDAAGRQGSRDDMKKVVNSLRDYFKVDFVPITEIRSKMLVSYEAYLRKPRTMLRLDQFGRLMERKSKGLSDVGLHNHMRDLRILFNDAVRFYNDREMGIMIIKHYPFENYKIASSPESNKRKLNVQQVTAIRDCAVKPGSRMEQARDLFMLSFYLCGMNSADIYKLADVSYKNSQRLDYHRSKTEKRRKDKAFISLGIPNIAVPLLEKYAGRLQTKYSNHITLDQAISYGMRKIGAQLGIPNLQFYDARHAFADMARNRCGFSKDDVALALNHKDNSNTITDIYISKNWNTIDCIQRSVLLLLETRNCTDLFCRLSIFTLIATGKNYV